MNDIDPQSSENASSDNGSSEAPSPQPLAAEPAPTGRPVSGLRRYRGLLIGGAAVAALGIGAAGVGVGTAIAGLNAASSTSTSQQAGGQQTYPGGGRGGFGTFNGTNTAKVNATASTAAQKVGVVTILSTLDYDDQSQAAGTGIILTSKGQILTNNHVVEGSTSIKVTIESTGTSYTAKVIGTDETDDIAVLQLVDDNGDDVTGLTPAKIDGDELSAGDAVSSVGNAEGTGDLVTASGTVTALNQSIQVANDISGADENLTGLIETNADVVSGDSGGPLIDAQGEVTGIVTAASSGGRSVTGYAIPIATATSIAKKIVNGEASSTIVIGLPAFLGVELASQQPTTGGVLISGIVAQSGAASTALAAGDTITAVDGTAVTSDSLSALVKSHAIGDTITVTYTDASGVSQQVAVTLAAGPAA
jgi:S1-C subfamily serine protease